MMALLVLFVLLLIVFQISFSAGTDARVTRNEEGLAAMDLAIESTLLQVYEDLAADAEADAAATQSAEGGAAAAGAAGAPEIAGGEGPQASDSREDEWATPRRTEMNEIRLRVLIQDEDSKFNLLSVLTENEEEAEKALERLTRVIDYARGGTRADIDSSQAERMAREILDFMTRRRESVLPKPRLLSDDTEDEERGLLLSLRELVALDDFTADMFRDYRDENGDAIHSLGSFLTVWTSLSSTGGEAGGSTPTAPAGRSEARDGADGQEGEPDPEGDATPRETGEAPQGGGEGGAPGQSGSGSGDRGASAGGEAGVAVNVNTAPPAVLKALVEDRDVPYRFWDDVIEYRNADDEEIDENEDPPLDEFGEPITVKQFFKSIDDLGAVDGWHDLEPILQGELRNLLTVQSHVFSIYVTARRPTGIESERVAADKWDLLDEDENGQGLVRSVRSVVWRRAGEDGAAEIVPLVRWEVLDYVPIEVLDNPERR